MIDIKFVYVFDINKNVIVCLFCNIIVLGIGFNMLFYWENLLLMIKML